MDNKQQKQLQERPNRKLKTEGKDRIKPKIKLHLYNSSL